MDIDTTIEIFEFFQAEPVTDKFKTLQTAVEEWRTKNPGRIVIASGTEKPQPWHRDEGNSIVVSITHVKEVTT